MYRRGGGWLPTPAARTIGIVEDEQEQPMTAEEAEHAHLRGPEGDPQQQGHRRMQELRKIGREYPFICPVDFKPHKGSPIGEDPNLDPDFIPNHREDDGAHYLA
jgi:hypothetical protein